MTPCPHTWIPLSASLDKCALCGVQQAPRWCRCINAGQFTRQEFGPPGTAPDRVTCLRCNLPMRRDPTVYIRQLLGEWVPAAPEPLSQAERDKRRSLPPEIPADALQDGAGPPMGRVLGTFRIDTTTIKGHPIKWEPITETESHD